MEKIAIFFGPLNGSVHRIAKMVATKIGPEKVDLIHIDRQQLRSGKYTKIIFGISTVGKDTCNKVRQHRLDKILPVVASFNFTGKKVALFGLGDHITYAYHFVDAVGLLGKTIKSQGGNLRES